MRIIINGAAVVGAYKAVNPKEPREHLRGVHISRSTLDGAVIVGTNGHILLGFHDPLAVAEDLPANGLLLTLSKASLKSLASARNGRHTFVQIADDGVRILEGAKIDPDDGAPVLLSQDRQDRADFHTVYPDWRWLCRAAPSDRPIADASLNAGYLATIADALCEHGQPEVNIYDAEPSVEAPGACIGAMKWVFARNHEFLGRFGVIMPTRRPEVLPERPKFIA